MRYRINEVDLQGNIQKDSGWWTWDETCDCCGKVIKTFGSHFNNHYPSSLEATFCNKCLEDLRQSKESADK